MKKYLLRLLYRTPGVPHNPLMHPFLLATAVEGIAFTFFTHTATVQQSVLYNLTLAVFSKYIISLWGIIALVLTVANLIGVMARQSWLGKIVAITGVGLWAYASVLYILNGFWLQFFFAGVTNVWFWSWYYFTISRYHRTGEEANFALVDQG